MSKKTPNYSSRHLAFDLERLIVDIENDENDNDDDKSWIIDDDDDDHFALGSLLLEDRVRDMFWLRPELPKRSRRRRSYRRARFSPQLSTLMERPSEEECSRIDHDDDEEYTASSSDASSR